jgi:hypothetical protein
MNGRVRLLPSILIALLALSAAPRVLAQGATATVRGTVTDSSGGILPGAMVMITNTATKDSREVKTDDRGGYLFAGLFPGTYDLKASLESFKTYELKGIALGPNEARGIDVRLEVGQQTETVTVTAETEVMQTETGPREGVLNAKQIDNLSIIGRSALNSCASSRASSPISTSASSSASAARANRRLHGQWDPRTSNTVSLDGSALIDIGSNNGVIVSLNNDMIQEVRSRARTSPRDGTGGMNVAGVTKSGSSKFHGSMCDYWRDHRFAANDRSNSIAGTEKPKSSHQYPAATSAVRSASATATRGTATSCSFSSRSKASARTSTRGLRSHGPSPRRCATATSARCSRTAGRT